MIAKLRATFRWILTQHRMTDEESVAELNKVRAMWGREPIDPFR